MCKYSFIIPVYNCAGFLDECVQSILCQNENDFEILLVNDGSVDDSGKLCDCLAEKYNCIRVFHKKNGGAASARNLGIDNAKGRYILFVDGDDTLDLSCLHSVGNTLNDSDSELVIFGMAFDYYNKHKLERTDILSCNYSGNFTYDKFISEFKEFFNDNYLSSACNKVFLSEIIHRNNLRFKEEMNLYEDFEFVLRYINCIDSLSSVNKPFYHYRHNMNNNHLFARVSDLSRLRINLHELLYTMLYLKKRDNNILDVAANLYIGLLIQNIMTQKITYKKLKNELTEYCSDENFRTVLQKGGKLAKREEELLSLIDNKQFFYIFIKYNIRKANSKIKRFIKSILIALRVKR